MPFKISIEQQLSSTQKFHRFPFRQIFEKIIYFILGTVDSILITNSKTFQPIPIQLSQEVTSILQDVQYNQTSRKRSKKYFFFFFNFIKENKMNYFFFFFFPKKSREESSSKKNRLTSSEETLQNLISQEKEESSLFDKLLQTWTNSV